MLAARLHRVARSNKVLGLNFIRGIKFLNKDYPPDKGFKLYSNELENAISDTITKFPANSIAFQNNDGTINKSVNDDNELKTAAVLALMSTTERATLLDRLKLTADQKDQLNSNNYSLESYYTSGRQILDKIPYEDGVTGEVKWEIIRANHKEGWENLAYFGYVPALLLMVVYILFNNNNNMADWALEELRIRSNEKYNDTMDEADEAKLSPEEMRKRDALIIERIISGDYDRLTGVKKSPSDLPASLL